MKNIRHDYEERMKKKAHRTAQHAQRTDWPSGEGQTKESEPLLSPGFLDGLRPGFYYRLLYQDRWFMEALALAMADLWQPRKDSHEI